MQIKYIANNQVSYAPAEVKTIQPEVTVQEPDYKYKSVPVAVPYAAPYYTAPTVSYSTYPVPVAAAAHPYAYGYAGYPYGYAAPAATVAV